MRRERGRRRVTALVFVAMAIAGCSSDKESGTKVLELSKSGAGTCLAVSDQLGAEVTKLPTVSCDKEHSHEIFGVVAYDKGDVFPGLEALNLFAESACATAFTAYTGASIFDQSMPLTFTWLTPTLGSWNDDDDRDILCVLANKDASPLTRSMKDAFEPVVTTTSGA